MNKLETNIEALLLAGVLSLSPAFTLASETAEGVVECLKINDQLVKKSKPTLEEQDDLHQACSGVLSYINKTKEGELELDIIENIHRESEEKYGQNTEKVKMEERIKADERITEILKTIGFTKISPTLAHKAVNVYLDGTTFYYKEGKRMILPITPFLIDEKLKRTTF